ncbi:MAG TPA: DUF3299 domain-containing protein, partial [Polyangiaceae bacterium]|nr:DUF3299 domain-containing protein [Polyangiaceae bacterium]
QCSCARDTSASPGQGQKVFAAPRTDAPKGDESPERRARRGRIEESVSTLLTAVVTGHLGDDQRSEAKRMLMSLLERERWGSVQNRALATSVVVQQLFDQARLQSTRTDLDARQRQAISGLARELTRQLMLMAVGLRAGADAISARLPGGYEAITWGQLGGFKYQEGGPLPAPVLALSGRKVGLPGFMLTLGQTGSSHEFVLVESLWGCCFGTSPGINQVVVVRRKAAQTADFSALPVVVLGTLEVGEEREGQFVTSLYRLRDAIVQTADGTASE